MPCELLLPKNHPKDKQICTNYVPGSGFPPAASCFGDSGGPLTVNENGYSVVIGIVSSGVGPCVPQSTEADIYTEVQAYLPWITKIIGQGSDLSFLSSFEQKEC